ncbi:MAG TPA: hypothetical protein VMF08_01840 [Candidatus Sulfotelmatobacter sp.]|nr:hypothetical protein [Candidatus Sulfotelmatobacter sp.]
MTARAWIRSSYEDETVVKRAELIAVGHLKADSIVYIPHESPEGKSWDYRATFVITEFIKGKRTPNEIPIIIHYGLTPIVGGYLKRDDGFLFDARWEKTDYPTNVVQIFDTSDAGSFEPIVKDVSKDNIWFLRRGTGISGGAPGTKDLGIFDPEDVQPLKLKGYFEAYLSQHPKEAVKAYASQAQHPDIAARAQRYLNHLEVQRILKIADPVARFNALLPRYLNQELWSTAGTDETGDEIRNGIVSCGSVVEDKLIPIFNDPRYKSFRSDIILIWRDTDSTNIAPFLIQLLKDHDQFWARQKLTNGWWNADIGSELTRERRDNYCEIYYSVAALQTFHFHGSQARDAIELTKKRWDEIAFDNPQIVEECDEALRADPDGK